MKERFMTELKHVWGIDSKKIKVTTSIKPGQKALAQLSYRKKARGRAIGSTLVRYPKEVELQVAPRFSKLSKKQQQKALRHEAGHIGHPRHTKEFRKLMDTKGGTHSEQHMKGSGYLLQEKRGSRFVTVGEFKNEKELQQFAKDYARGKKGIKLRVKI